MKSNLEKSISTLQQDGIHLTRLPSIIEAVWERLPEYDREYIAQNVYLTVHDMQDDFFLPELGAVTMWINDAVRNQRRVIEEGTQKKHGRDFTSSVVVPGIESDYYQISFRADIDTDVHYTETFLRGIVAHEFAHAVLRHSQISVYLLSVGREEGNNRAYTQYNEFCVDIQLRIWGFNEEADAHTQYLLRAFAAAMST